MERKLEAARAAVANRAWASARAHYEELLTLDAYRAESLEQLVLIALQTGEPATAEQHLRTLVSAYPDQLVYRKRLATLLEQQQRFGEAAACYQKLLEGGGDNADLRYNLARLLQRSGAPESALEQYGECLRSGIERPEEVHNNMGIIQGQLQRHAAARASFLEALECSRSYLPALFNLAVLEEEHGRWDEASALFRRILAIDPRHAGALVRLVNGTRVRDPADPLFRRMKRMLRSSQVRGLDREELLYALGKASDDSARYTEAFDWYRQANTASRQRAAPYDPGEFERQVSALIAHCDASWLRRIAPASDRPHVFICGMFRSGSTLVEQVLGAHPALTAGGELDFFQRALEHWPESPRDTGDDELAALARAYDDLLDRQFFAGARVTNKRPDNFLFLGLLAALYPQARFIETRRHPLDNCLSLYFQPFGAQQPYANDLLDCGHYYVHYRRLMAHWRELLGERLLGFDYEGLVKEPGQRMRVLTDFVSLPWDPACLQFHALEGRVRTASVHQVRQPLYTHADGRWRNYEQALEPLRQYLSQHQVPDL